VPALSIFESSLRRGKFDANRKLSNGGMMEFSNVYPMDAVYDTPEDVPEDVSTSQHLTYVVVQAICILENQSDLAGTECWPYLLCPVTIACSCDMQVYRESYRLPTNIVHQFDMIITPRAPQMCP